MGRSVFRDFTATYDAGEVLFSAGEGGSTLFVVQSGAVELLSASGASLGVMEKGDFFGEMSLLEGAERTFTARAVEKATVIEISPPLFDQIIRGNIEMAVRMLRKLSIRVADLEGRLPAAAEPLPITDSPPAPRPAPAPAAPPITQNAAGGPAGPAWLLHGDAQVFPLNGGQARVGRFDPVTGTRPEVDLTLLDMKRSVSRRHALIAITDGQYTITEEVGALNGTTLNGRRLTTGEPVKVGEGDEVGFGGVLLTFTTTAP